MITPQEFFTLLSDETRLRCLLLLHKEKELCVCELTHALGSIQPKISRHLSLLRKSGLILDERRGQWVYYRMSEKLENWMKQVLASTGIDLKNIEPYKSDSSKLCAIRCTTPCK